MGRKKKEPDDADNRNCMIYTCPYLNLVNAIFERLINDLTLETVTDVFPWKKSKGDFYYKHCRWEAYRFFFDEGTKSYKAFLKWCDLTGFDYRFWQKKALAAVVIKVLNTPHFYSLILKRTVKPNILQKIDKMLAQISKSEAWSPEEF